MVTATASGKETAMASVTGSVMETVSATASVMERASVTESATGLVMVMGLGLRCSK